MGQVGVRGPAGMPTLSRRSKIAIGIGVGILVLLLVGPRLVGLITDWLWMSDVGYTRVFSTVMWTRVILFLVTTLVVGLLIFGAIAMAYRSRPVFVPASGPNDPLARYRSTVMGRTRWFAIVPAVIIGILAGLVTQGSWATVQTFLHGEQFGVTDPQFGIDVSFYAFDLPFIRLVLNLLFVIVVIAFLANLLTHYLFGGIRLTGGGANGNGPSFSNASRIQLAALAGTFLLLKAAAYWLDRYSLLSSQRKQDIFTGASYTDINAVLPSKLILMAIAIICAVAFFAGIVLRDLRVPALATALMLLSALVIGVGWPLAMEQFSVKPNAAQKESEYISRNITATEQAYGIGPEQVTTQPNWTAEPVNQPSVDADTPTLSNIRILDPNIVSPAFTQLQQRQNFYGFPTQLALDRYDIDGEMRDFVVAVREIDPARLVGNQTNWLNKHLVYTHGNGFVAAPANRVNQPASDDVEGGGSPVFFVSDLSNYQTEEYQNEAPIKVTQPRIYFGELISQVDPDYAIVGSNSDQSREYDTQDSTYTYQGDAGVSLGNYFNRLLYSIRFAERNFLLSGEINENSKLLYDRDPRDRVKKVAPWLTVDSKTYPAVMADGSIKWIVDGYTTLDNYPYAQRTSLQAATTDAQELNQGQTGRTQVNRSVSYVRNSVKATVDAYTGEVTLYQFDDQDPVLRTWMNIFPGTVKSRAEFDQQESLADHVRYPEDLFKIQRSLLTKYHVTNPQQFFEGSDFWSVPSDPTNEDADAQGLDQPPYFFVASSPENGQPSFQLTSVLTRLNRPILGAYMTVSSDPTDYGQITVKTIPTNIQRDGPRQAFNPMQQDDRVAESRRNFQGNVDVMFGNLLTLPVGNSGILYVVPMYAQARGEGTYPRLFRVITRYENRVGYAPTTAGALSQVGINPQGAALVPGETTPQPEAPEQTEQPPAGEQQQVTPPATGSTAERDAALQAISEALDALEQAQSAGNFTAYGEALDQLNEAVQRYEALPN
ncbi:UPF0182 family protein [Gordonia sp. Z-3]|nr:MULTISPECIES: UPF0182 family protein [Gordonia]MAU84763.1 membrane protein [Gordonia sp. (in: high G+C Gram-positive bacteria)]MED5799727.1 UPF0182 family protein [Gordonia sp. Z-3]